MIGSGFGFGGGGGGSMSSGVQSVTGLNTNNIDPQNPIIEIALSSGFSGLGTAISPLALDIKTINGNSLIGTGDLSVGGLNVGTTAIGSGSVGGLLFQGTGNLLQQNSNLNWDNTNLRLAIGTPTQAYTLAVNGKLRVSSNNYWVNGQGSAFQVDGTASFSDTLYMVSNKAIQWGSTLTQISGFTSLNFRGNSGSNGMTLFSTGNLLVQTGGTQTDAGFKLDVNGTSRIQSSLTLGTSSVVTAFLTSATTQGLQITSTYFTDFVFGSTKVARISSNSFGLNSFINVNIAFGFDPTSTTPASAKIEIGAGTSTAGTAPLKLRAGTNLTTPENGAFEYDGTNLYFTTGGIRKTISLI